MNRFRNAYTPHLLQRHNSPTPPIGRHLLKQPRSLGVSINVGIVPVLVLAIIVREPVQLKLIGVAHVPVRGGRLVVDELVGGRGGARSDVEEDVRDWETFRISFRCDCWREATHRGT